MSQSINSEYTLDTNDRDFLNSLFFYSDGDLYWKKNGKIAGYTEVTRYRRLTIPHLKMRVRLHRVIYVMFHGPIPEGYQVHHKDGDRTNNRIENLEAVSSLKHGSLKNVNSLKIVFNQKTQLWECLKRYNYKNYIFTSTSKSGVSRIVNNFLTKIVSDKDIICFNKYIVKPKRERKPGWFKSFECNQESIRKHLYYLDGHLYQRNNNRRIGCVDASGYGITQINNKSYLLHRLIYIYHYGDIQKGLLIDHIDCDKSNNDISNLRAVSPSINSINRLDTSNANSVYLRNNKWVISVILYGKRFQKSFHVDQKQEAIDFKNEVVRVRENFDALVELFGYSDYIG